MSRVDTEPLAASSAARPRRLPRIDRRFLPVLGASVVLVLMLLIGQLRYSTPHRGFISLRLFSNLVADNSYLLVLAVGMTFVILTGGIDLSVGAVVALVGLVIAVLLTAGVPLPVVLLIALLVGAACGTLIGIMVHYFDVQPFIASLAVMFLARGLCNIISVQSLSITDPGFGRLASWGIKLGTGSDVFRINASLIIAVIVIVAGFLILHYTRVGRTVYALGSGDDGLAAGLMGLPVGFTRVGVYVLSGVCAGIAGIMFALYTKSGFNLTGIGMELDAIAPVAIGGTLLIGGSGFVLGSVVGVFVYGLLQVIIAREGLDSWWTKVLIGVFLLIFVLLQRVVSARRSKG